MPIVIQRGELPKPLILVELTPENIRDLLLSLPDSERVFVITNPSSNEHKIYSIRRNASGNLEYEYDTEAQH